MIKSKIMLIAGLLILCFGIAILSANKAERAEKITDELVETTTLSPENEGKLIILAGTPEIKGNTDVTDEAAGLKAEGAVLWYARNPLMKVYYESREQIVVERKKTINDDDIVETWDVVRTMWGDPDLKREDVKINGLLRSSDYDADGKLYPTGTFKNPDPVSMDSFRVSNDLYIGGFKVNFSDIIKYAETEKHGYTEAQLEKIRAKYSQDIGAAFDIVTNKEGFAFLSTGDEVGDLRVEISYALLKNAEPVTLVGRQRGDSLVLEEDDIVSEAEQVQAGIISRKDFLKAIAKEDTTSRYIGIGFAILGAILTAFSLNIWKRKKGKG